MLFGKLNIEKKWLVLLGTGVSGIAIGLDLTIVNASLISIQKDLSASLNQLQWIMAGFGLMFCAFLVSMGRFADIHGRKKLLIYSLIGFALASLGAGLAATPVILIIMRVLQGLFGSAILPCSTAITADSFPKGERGRALGIYGSLVGIGIGFGPIIGAIIDGASNWRWIFFINIPIVAVSLVLTFFTINESKLSKKAPIDYLGAVLLTLSLGSFAFVISEGGLIGWSSLITLFSIMFCVLTAVSLYYHEKKISNPIIPTHLFKNSGFILGTLIYAGAVAFHWPVLFIMPIYLQKILGYNTETANLLLSAMTIMTIISPVVAGYFFDKKYKGLTVHIVFGLNVFSLLLFMTLGTKGSLYVIIPSFILYGLAWGIGNGIATPVALSGFENTDDAGVVSGALTTILNIFSVISLTLVNTIFQLNEKKHFIKQMTQILPEESRFVLTHSSIVEMIPRISKLNPNVDPTQIIKLSFSYGMNIVYGLIVVATLLCWFISYEISKKIF